MTPKLDLPETESCAVCGAGTAHRVRETRPYPIDRWSVPIEDDFYRCDRCGKEFYTPEQSEAADQRAAAAAREQFGLLPPGEIRALRERLGLTQAEFEALLGVGRNTVVRWESGLVRPNAATNALLRLLDDEQTPPAVRMVHGLKLSGAVPARRR